MATFSPLKHFGETCEQFNIKYIRCFLQTTLDKMKVIPILNCTCTVLLITSQKFQLTHRYRYQFVGEVMTDI